MLIDITRTAVNILSVMNYCVVIVYSSMKGYIHQLTIVNLVNYVPPL